ncbi:YciI family protein [Bosea sp. PAMC 26642]|uniref:YciI family protein n=1 Tax=Bosea sp. (strain PAMC 26642) TaxID=1792307 RepID=UPI000770048C|nr:YciI family protein [Bosea sp. PAMC 26642]AMJ61121.1 hypothetical protein AXW83_13195 [Bosea sp. PAMC 26642]
MLFAIHCLDQPDGPALRKAHYDAHQAYLKQVQVRLVIAGPLEDSAGTTAIGSFLLIEANSVEDAVAFNQGDPFFKAGVWQRVDINRFNKRWDDRAN